MEGTYIRLPEREELAEKLMKPLSLSSTLVNSVSYKTPRFVESRGFCFVWLGCIKSAFIIGLKDIGYNLPHKNCLPN